MLFISPFRVREITNLTTTPLPSRNEKFISPKQTQSSRRDIKSLEDSETQQSKKLTSLDKRSVELQVRRETDDGDHESEDLSEDTGENFRHIVHKSANRYTLVSLDTTGHLATWVL